MGLPVIDIHVHVAGIGQGETGCWIAPAKFHSLMFRSLRYLLGIGKAHREGRLDQAYMDRLKWDFAQAKAQTGLDAMVLLAHDRIYLEDGRAPEAMQEIYVPNEYVFALAKRPEWKGIALPAISVHPFRHDALEETRKWIDQGAVAMKWLPNSQWIEPLDRKCFPLFDLLARHGLPLIVHTGGEHTVTVRRPELGDPERMREALDRGVKVVFAHCATKSGLWDTDWYPTFARMVKSYPNAWGDISALATPGRSRWMDRMLKDEQVMAKLVQGSDYPVPPSAWPSLLALGRKRAIQLGKIRNFLGRDIEIKRARGFPEAVFRRAGEVLRPGFAQTWGVRMT